MTISFLRPAKKIAGYIVTYEDSSDGESDVLPTLFPTVESAKAEAQKLVHESFSDDDEEEREIQWDDTYGSVSNLQLYVVTIFLPKE